MNRLDRLVMALSPRAGLRRLEARVRADGLAQLRRAYQGADVGRRTQGWVTLGGSADAEIYGARGWLKNRARDLERNNPWAPQAIKRVAASIGGMTPRMQARTPELSRLATDLFLRWWKRADAYGVGNFGSLERSVLRALVRDGGVLAQRALVSPRDMEIPLQIRLLEVDHLDATRDVLRADGGRVENGKEFDARGRRVRYHLFPVHPGAVLGGTQTVSVPVPASEILHVYEALRPGQQEGVTWLAPAILKLRDLDLLDEAVLVAKQMQACLALFVTRNDPEATLTGAKKLAAERLVEGFSPGMTAYLDQGEQVTVHEPKGSPAEEALWTVQLRAVAAAVGMPYELLTGDLTKVSFSGGRMGNIPWNQRKAEVQDEILVPQFLDPVSEWWVEIAKAVGRLPAEEDFNIVWAPARAESIQPMEDAQEEHLRLRNGTLTLFDALARRGYDPPAALREIKAGNDLVDELEIILDSDPRRVTDKGQVQTPAVQQEAAGQPAAPAARSSTALGRVNGHSLTEH
jgi:lambda family phage portal protein